MQTSNAFAAGDAHAPIERATQRLVDFYERLTPAQLATLDTYYAPDAHFRDPFNDVRGVPAIAQIFAHMFATLEQPGFIVTQRIVQGNQAFLGWEFRFRMRRWRGHRAHCIHGASVVRFDADGRVALHHDYWDPAQGLYEKLPVLGGLMRWLRHSASATAPRSDSRPGAARPTGADAA